METRKKIKNETIKKAVKKTVIQVIDEQDINEAIIKQAGDCLQAGGLVAFPTETVYGLGADALNPEAQKKTYEAKGRPSDNPLIIHIATLDALDEITEDKPESVYALAKRFWPGPLTMIFHKSKQVPLETTGGLETVAVRMPENEVARELIKAGGGYISAPSANISGKPSPTTAKHVEEDMFGCIDMILDGGPVKIGVESTILDMTVTPPMILRPGAITRRMLEDVLPKVGVDPAVYSLAEHIEAKAPGMKYRHYAPNAPLILVEGSQADVIKAINLAVQDKKKQGLKVGIIGTDESVSHYEAQYVKSIGTRMNENSIARNLYAILREFDEENIDYAFSESFSEEGIGLAIMNRLYKAAGYKRIEAAEIIKLHANRKETN
jgi:Sua5/YciO/YrdC/YwlC family protein